MPQTSEHVRILRVLRHPPLLAVLTKIDLTDAATVELRRNELAAFLALAGFPDAPIVACSSKTGDGLDLVWDGLERLVAAVTARPTDPRAFRIAVERSFVAAGHGTVVTGIPVSGSAAPGEALEILPDAIATAVRGVQVYKRSGGSACAGTCVAINLRDAELSTVPRGTTIAAPGWYRPTSEAVIDLESVAAALSLPRQAAVRVHAGTAAVTARARLLNAENLPPGERALVHVHLDEPLVLAAGDRVLVRLLTPAATIGGGPVVTTTCGPIARRDAERIASLALAAARAATGDGAGAEFLAAPEPVVAQAEAVRLIAVPGANPALHPLLTALGPGWWLVKPRLAEAATRVGGVVDRYHHSHPDDHGLGAEAACAALGLPVSAFAALATALGESGLVVRHGHLARAGHAPALNPRLRAARERLLALLASAGAKPPARGDLQTAIGLPERDFAQLLRLGSEAGDLHLVGNHVIAAAIHQVWRGHLVALFRASGRVELAAFRTASGLSRNLAVEFLDACDRDGITRRVGDNRVLTRGGSA